MSAEAAVVEELDGTAAEIGVPAPPADLRIGRQVFLLALPMLGEQFVNFLLGVTDTWLAGHISKEATGAVGMATYLGWLSGLIFMLVGTGAAALVSRSIGAGDRSTANRALHQAFLMALVFGVVANQLMFHSAGFMAGFFAPSPEAQVLFERFIRIDAWGYILYALLLTCGGVCRAAGDTRTPMRVMIVVNIVNIFVASGFVFGWFGSPWGVAGIATGTLIARCLGGVLMTAVMVRGHLGMRLELSQLIPDFAVMWRMLRVGLPALADGGLMFAAQLAFVRIISHSDPDAQRAAANFAAHTIAMRIEAITYLPAVAWMTAAATLVGQFLGANKPQLAARSGHLAAAQGAILGGTSCLLFFLFADPIFRFMSNDPAVHAAGAAPFRALAFAQPFLCVAIVYIGALRGAGDTRTTMIFSLIGGLLLRVPVAYLGASVLGWGLLGAWMGMWADNVAKATMSFGRFVHGGWKGTKV